MDIESAGPQGSWTRRPLARLTAEGRGFPRLLPASNWWDMGTAFFWRCEPERGLSAWSNGVKTNEIGEVLDSSTVWGTVVIEYALVCPFLLLFDSLSVSLPFLPSNKAFFICYRKAFWWTAFSFFSFKSFLEEFDWQSGLLINYNSYQHF